MYFFRDSSGKCEEKLGMCVNYRFNETDIVQRIEAEWRSYALVN